MLLIKYLHFHLEFHKRATEVAHKVYLLSTSASDSLDTVRCDDNLDAYSIVA